MFKKDRLNQEIKMIKKKYILSKTDVQQRLAGKWQKLIKYSRLRVIEN